MNFPPAGTYSGHSRCMDGRRTLGAVSPFDPTPLVQCDIRGCVGVGCVVYRLEAPPEKVHLCERHAAVSPAVTDACSCGHAAAAHPMLSTGADDWTCGCEMCECDDYDGPGLGRWPA